MGGSASDPPGAGGWPWADASSKPLLIELEVLCGTFAAPVPVPRAQCQSWAAMDWG